ncbi:putative NADH-ubiquinone oxidoreductase 12 kDa subunit mitochondrial precursor [Mycena maculata]|uniref:NADH-ubiquinone oxidoreductase 12 kDa subunit mitochondrial n=1 Tax=Mycena maculata TaxID=230809 RepID=A0AAD7HL02_9AGAR|nr:putative NADH-ubiquinone oxidoreductase 12 kDa subunit mitochondrial precursor [Mycena maculata]
MSAVDADNVTKQMYQAKMAARDVLIKESWVKAMEARLVRDELEKCRKGEGANAMENCRWLAEKYAQMLQDNKLQGYKTIDRA